MYKFVKLVKYVHHEEGIDKEDVISSNCKSTTGFTAARPNMELSVMVLMYTFRFRSKRHEGNAVKEKPVMDNVVRPKLQKALEDEIPVRNCAEKYVTVVDAAQVAGSVPVRSVK